MAIPTCRVSTVTTAGYIRFDRATYHHPKMDEKAGQRMICIGRESPEYNGIWVMLDHRDINSFVVAQQCTVETLTKVRVRMVHEEAALDDL